MEEFLIKVTFLYPKEGVKDAVRKALKYLAHPDGCWKQQIRRSNDPNQLVILLKAIDDEARLGFIAALKTLVLEYCSSYIIYPGKDTADTIKYREMQKAFSKGGEG